MIIQCDLRFTFDFSVHPYHIPLMKSRNGIFSFNPADLAPHELHVGPHLETV